MSIPGKLLIALLSALAVSAIAGELSETLSLGMLFGPTAVAALLSVVLSHKALPMPSGMASAEADSRKPAPGKSSSDNTAKREQKPRRQKPKNTQSSNANPPKRNDKKPSKTAPENSSNAAISTPQNADAALEGGTVKWFNGSKGFGFLIRENGEEVFVHHRSIVGEGRRNLSDGAAVRFRVVHTDKGPQAEDVQPES